MSISSDEINFLIYRYLQENGFAHSAFTFAYESLVIKSSTAQTEIPPGALITFLQKGLEYIAIEEHINEDGSVQDYDNNFSLLSPLICEAVAVKEDRRIRRTIVPPPLPTTSSLNSLHSHASLNGSNSGNGTSMIPVDSSTPMAVDDMGSSATSDQVALASNNPQADTTSSSVSSRAAACTPSTVQLVNEESGSRYLQLNGHQGEVFMCLWSPSQQQLASGSADGMCRLWSLSEMNQERWESKESEVRLSTAILPHLMGEGELHKDVTSVTWSPDGKFLATGCYDGMARIWDNHGKLVSHLRVHTGPVFSMKWNKLGNYLLSGSYDRRAVIWNALTGEMYKSFGMHSGPVLDVDWKDSEIFATCSSDRTIYVCRVEDPTPLRALEGHSDEVNAVCWSPGGALLASCSDDNTAKIWSLEDGLRFDLKGHLKEIFTIKWTPTGEGSVNPDKPLLLCTASFDGTVKVWSGLTGELVSNLCRQVQPVYSLSPSPNGEFIATGSLGGAVSIWSLASGTSVKELQGSGDTFDVSWSTDGALLCCCFSSGTLIVIDTSHVLSITG